MTPVLWIRCKWVLAFSDEYIHSCLLEYKWGWGIEFHRLSEAAHIFLTTNECCSEMHWFSIILPKASDTIQLAFRCSTDVVDSLRIRPMEIKASTTLHCTVWNACMMRYIKIKKKRFMLCGFQANSLDMSNTVCRYNRYNSPFVVECLGSAECCWTHKVK